MTPLALALLLVAAPAARPQTAPQDRVTAMLQEFSSADPGVRARAFRTVNTVPGALARPAVAAATVRLLNTENAIAAQISATPADATLNASLEKEFGQHGYAQYLQQLTGTVAAYAQHTGDPAAIVAVLGSPDLLDPHWMVWLGGHATPVLSDLVTMAGSKTDYVRCHAVGELGIVLAVNKRTPNASVPTAERARAKAAIIAALGDSDPDGAAHDALQALWTIKDPGDQALVQQSAARAPMPQLQSWADWLLAHWSEPGVH